MKTALKQNFAVSLLAEKSIYNFNITFFLPKKNFMKSTYRIPFLIFWLVILMQTAAIAHFWTKIYEPIDLNLLEALNETIDLQERSIKLRIDEDMELMGNIIRKELRGNFLLQKTEILNKLTSDFLFVLDSLQNLPNTNIRQIAKEIDKEKHLFHTAISAEMLSDFEKEDVAILNANLNLYKDVKLLSSFKVNDAILEWLIEQEKTNVLTRNRLFIDILFGKMSYGSIIYEQYRVAMMSAARKIEKGDWFSTKIYLAQRDFKVLPRIFVDGKRLKIDKYGRAIYECATDELGKQSIKGTIRGNSSGSACEKYFPFTIDYEVLEKCN